MPLRNVAGNFLADVPAFLCRSHFRVQGGSMHPTLMDGDLLHVLPRRWSKRGFKRGAVVVARSPAGGEEFWVKRILGLPGEFVSITTDGVVLVDDSPVDDRHGPLSGVAGLRPGNWFCDDDEYFLLGDNRADSGDSRRYGPVAWADIVGRVWLRWPIRRGGPPRRRQGR